MTWITYDEYMNKFGQSNIVGHTMKSNCGTVESTILSTRVTFLQGETEMGFDHVNKSKCLIKLTNEEEIMWRKESRI